MELKKHIEQFKRDTGYNLIEKDGKPYYGGYLYLRCTGITSLPEGLTVGGSLYLRGTGITSLPEGLTVGGSLYLRGTGITDTSMVIRELTAEQRSKIANHVNQPIQWDWNGRSYIKIDDVFSVVDSHKGNVWHVHQLGSNEKMYVVCDGENHYAHGKTLKEAKADLKYKINNRDTSAYKALTLDDKLTFIEAIAAYRTITGACAAGTRNFVENFLPKPYKDSYTIREIINLTKGQYGSETFSKFFS